MAEPLMADVVAGRLRAAAGRLGASDPLPYVKPLLYRSFPLPAGDAKYAQNALTPGAAPCEPSYSEREPDNLQFTIEPLEPGAPPISRRDEATREMRRLVGPLFGPEALRWLDARNEDFRGAGSQTNLEYGAWIGATFDEHGLAAAKVDYEMQPGQTQALPHRLRSMVRDALEAIPNLVPVSTSIKCGRECGNQGVAFVHRGPLRLAGLHGLLHRMGMAHQLPGMMQIIGLVLGGRFDLPERSILVGLKESPEGPELQLDVLLGRIPDVPPSFLDLLALGLAERPRELHALGRFLRAFTPESQERPGNFSVLRVRTTPGMPARVSLGLRPVEFEIHRRLSDVSRLRPERARAYAGVN
jgi:hypothetical protein